MPVRKCGNGKYRIGSGPCVYTTRDNADEAYRAYLADINSEEDDDDDRMKEATYNDYPEAATNNAKRALKYKEENGSSCGTPVGWRRASQLANRQSISRSTIARMASFKRHQANKDVPYDEGCGGIMWDAWGGDAGVEWAIRKLEQIDEKIMKPKFSKKIYDLKALDVDNETKRVKIAFSQMETVDRDGDIILPTAFDRTFRERGPEGTNEIWHLLDHTKDSFSALGKFKELWKTNTHAGGVSEYRNSFAWREVAWPLYESGDFTQHSIGFTVTDQEQKKEYNIIKEVALWEGSAVLWGANPNTPTMEIVKGLLNTKDDREITAAEKIEEIIRKVRKDKFTDDMSLLIVELKRLQALFDSKQIAKVFEAPTEPPVETEILPGNDTKMRDALDILILKHF